MKKCLISFTLATSFLLTAQSAESDWFNVSFDGYANGQQLTGTGATGGAWQSPIPNLATNINDGVRNGIAVSAGMGEELAFVPVVAPDGKDIERIDFGLCAESLGPFPYPDFDGAAGLAPAKDEDGTAVFYGFTTNGWVRLTGEGVAPADGEWFDGRIELRTVDGIRLVSYLVKNGGGVYVRLADDSGTSWFRTSAPRVQGGVESISFTGTGRFSDFGGKEDDGDPMRVFHWAGGASGDWSDPANWTTNGVAAGTVPGAAGDIAIVDGTATLANGSDSGTVRDFTVSFDENGAAQLMGGSLETSVTLDTKRPRAGTPLAATVGSFLGLAPDYTFTWLRGSTAKAYETAAVGNTASFTPTTADYEHWFKFTTRDGDGATVLEKEFFFSKLPVFYMTTDDGQTPSANKEKHDGWVLVQGNDQWKSLYDGKMTINVRGNSTKSYPKKPWKLKLDKKTEMFGIPKSKHWVLLANYNDQSMMRNKLAGDFANDIGSLGMKSTWVECVLNGAWQGTYQFGEQIRVAKDRVNVHDWEGDAGDIAEAFAKANGLTGDQEDELATQLEQNFAWVTADTFPYLDKTNNVTLTGQPSKLLKKFTNDISGGYLFEFSEEYDEVSKFTTSSGVLGVRTMMKSPEYLYTNTDMFNYCQDYLKKYWDACTSWDGYNAGEDKWIGDYCDYESMVNYWLVMEMFGNNDAVKKSRYAYKEQGQKLVFGPVWDFDWGVGSLRVSSNGTGWKCQDASGKEAYSFFKDWADSPEFCTRLHTRYWQVRDRFAACMADGGLIDQYTNFLYEACLANSAKWDDKNNGWNVYNSSAFGKDVARLKSYLAQRLDWLDQQFASVPTLMVSVRRNTSNHPYTADATTLPIAFAGLNRKGHLYTRQPLQVSFTVGGSTATTVSCFVNGIRVVEKQALDGNRVFAAEIPSSAFTAAIGEPNCVSFIAYNSSGEVVARNYALVTQERFFGTVIKLR